MLFATLVVVVAAAAAAVERYDGHAVLEGVVRNDATVRAVDALGLDVWLPDGGPVMVNHTAHVRVPGGADGEHARAALRAAGFEFGTFVDDVQALIDAEAAANARALASADADFFDSYHSYEEIVEFTKELATKYNVPGITFVPSIGQSVEGRDQVALLVRVPSPSGAAKHGVHFNGGQHAREWIGPATVLYIMDGLLSAYADGDEQVVKLLQTLDLLFVPSVNPDGYTYSRESTRLWRKNRATNSGSSCRGVDLNRNWGYKFGGGGTSTNPCSDIFHGGKAFNQPETANLHAFMVKEGKGELVGAIDFHSYSQLILRAYGWTNSPAPDETVAKALGADMAAAIKANSGLTYQNIKSIELYTTTGSAGDHFYELGNTERTEGDGDESTRVPASYTFELRDTGRFGFVLPPDQIKPTGSENYDAFLVFLEHCAAVSTARHQAQLIDIA